VSVFQIFLSFSFSLVANSRKCKFQKKKKATPLKIERKKGRFVFSTLRGGRLLANREGEAKRRTAAWTYNTSSTRVRTVTVWPTASCTALLSSVAVDDEFFFHKFDAGGAAGT
jgi:hypothetical protein